jgi:hypothetical protein
MDFTQLVADLKAELSKIDHAIAALLGFGTSSRPRRGRPPKSALRRRKMSADARKRIGMAMKLAWAKRKGKSASKKGAAPAKKATVRRPMSPAMKKKMSALMKARWAARKKAGAKAL